MTFILKIANKSFPMTLWLMIMHHHTKFGYKKFSGSEDIICKNSDWSLDLQCGLENGHQTKFGCKQTSTFKIYSRNSNILIKWVLLVTLTLKTANPSFSKTLWLMMIHRNTKFGYKRLSSTEGTVQTKSGQVDRQTHRFQFTPLLFLLN